MKLLLYCTACIVSAVTLFSCAGDDLKLYHEKEPEPEPQPYWLLETVTYPEARVGSLSRRDLLFEYADNDSINKVEIGSSDYLNVNYTDKEVAYWKATENPASTVYDSLLVKLNDKKQAEYMRHISCMKSASQNGDTIVRMSINDSIALKYDAEGYLVQLESYGTSGLASSLRLTETYTIRDGNLVEAVSKSRNNQYIYTYSYDDKEYARHSGFCYEMPRNITSYNQLNCTLSNSLSLFAEYLGKANKNNITRAVITLNEQPYADVAYEYQFNENNLVSQVKMSGTVNGRDIPDDYITSFTYLEKLK